MEELEPAPCLGVGWDGTGASESLLQIPRGILQTHQLQGESGLLALQLLQLGSRRLFLPTGSVVGTSRGTEEYHKNRCPTGLSLV